VCTIDVSLAVSAPILPLDQVIEHV
jgi:hypothetical protein